MVLFAKAAKKALLAYVGIDRTISAECLAVPVSMWRASPSDLKQEVTTVARQGKNDWFPLMSVHA